MQRNPFFHEKSHYYKKAYTKLLLHFNGNFIDAIDNYVRASVPIITKLIKSICGTDAIKDM